MLLAGTTSAFLAGCADTAHFDAAQYKIVSTSAVLRDYAGAGSFAQTETWLFNTEGYVPLFCAPTSTTVASGRSVAIEWEGCAYGGDRINGELGYTAGGKYEGLVHVTLTLPTGQATFDTWLALEPADLPPAE